MGTTLVRRSSRLELGEVSAICVRQTAVGHELLAVGDKGFDVVVAELSSTGVGTARSNEVAHFFPPGKDGEREKSEWEGLASDAEGRVFVLEEGSGTVHVLSPDLGELVQTIQLDVSGSRETDVARLFDDPNAGAEAVVLLPPGDLLVAKQRDPVIFVQFGDPDRRRSAARGTSLVRDTAFELPKGARARLHALRHWTMPKDDERTVESVNDLAVDPSGRLYAISSKSHRIYRLDVGGRKVRIDKDWKLADDIRLSKDRRPEGLAFDPSGHPLVALDTHGDGDNVFVLATLAD